MRPKWENRRNLSTALL